MSTGKRPRRAPQAPPPAPPPPPPAPKRQPEKKFGPYKAGIGVTIWLNEVQTEDGPRLMRSITIAPRRYFDREREEWRDAKSYHPHDLVLLLIALQQAIEYVFTTPVPGERPEDDDTPF
jgi:hypothetical protein